MRYFYIICWVCCGFGIMNASSYMKDGDYWMGFLNVMLAVVNWRIGNSLYVLKQNLKGE